ncbi:hypothetical protein [Streptomyces griseorubiginosus]|uniref:hypothetical protein n=1 Tax=Streptomyces griseorubiginosus TaxID=67304 RepID=UPI0011404A9A|nr:hypothetical protein [Streptomyces griseorubiginosus]
MPVIRTARPTPAPAEPAVPRLEHVVAFRFSAADRSPSPGDPQPYVDHLRALHRAAGSPDPTVELAWLTEGARVSYHDMVRVVVERMRARLDDVDLVVTVDASPDCRHQSFPACLLGAALPGDPLVLGISEQGVAGPFTALRLAHDQLRAGLRRRALVLVVEQSTLPPGSFAGPVQDVAVALLLGNGPGPGPRLERPEVGITGRGLEAAPAPPASTDAHLCAGVWLTLADQWAGPGGPPYDPEGRLVVADRDPVLPYACRAALTRTAPLGQPDALPQVTARPVLEPVA